MTWLTEPVEEVDALFDCLSHRRCRLVLAYLQETGSGSATVDELIDAVVEGESSSPDRERVAISLHHTHLPKLADTDFVAYDPDRGVVTIADRAAELMSQLSATARAEPTEVEIE